MEKKDIWEQRRYETAKAAMQALLSNPKVVFGITAGGDPMWGAPYPLAKTVVEISDLLIEELKKKGGQDIRRAPLDGKKGKTIEADSERLEYLYKQAQTTGNPDAVQVLELLFGEETLKELF